MSTKKFEIPTPKLSLTEKIHFSFEYYDTLKDKYCLSCWEKSQIKDTLNRLKEINCKTLNELKSQRGVYHFREVYWEQTTEKQGFNNPSIKTMETFHFALLGINNQKARVYGVYSSNVFYIVWFDLNHTIWPSFKKHT